MIYICNHKENLKLVGLPEGYKIMGVGPVCDHLDKDNINYLNPYINETTGLYNIWKNIDDKYVGLAHYRRAFLDPDDITKILTLEKAKEILMFNDIICTPYHDLEKYTIIEYLKYCFGTTSYKCEEVCDIFFKKLSEKDPGIGEYFNNRHDFIARNMFVCKKEVINKYCEWLFPIIIPLAEEFKDNYLKQVGSEYRIIGHFAERMFSYWLDREGLKKFHLMYYTNEEV